MNTDEMHLPAAVWLDDCRIDCTDDTADQPEPLAVLSVDDSWVELAVPVEIGEGETDEYGTPVTELLTVRFPRWLIPHPSAAVRPASDVGYELICRHRTT